MSREIRDSEWQNEVLDSKLPVLVDVYSSYCGPCRMLAPTIERLSTEFEGRAQVVKLNTHNGTEVAASLGVTAVPTVLAFQDGREVGRIVGFRPEAAYRELLGQAGAV